MSADNRFALRTFVLLSTKFAFFFSIAFFLPTDSNNLRDDFSDTARILP